MIAIWDKTKRGAYQQELEKISDMLGALIDRSHQVFEKTEEDTLNAKIYSQLEKIQAMFESYDQRLWEEQDSIKRLISEIAHQFRTPLTNMETYIELLSESQKLKDKEYLAAIYQSEQKISFLAESFIKMSRLEHNVIQIRKEAKDLRSTILKSMLQVQKKAQEKQINLVLEQIEEVSVPHDSNWLGEVLVNLLDNSIKYSHEMATVTIRVLQNEMFTGIQIEDEGLGIEKGEENKIFQRFYRGNNVTTQEGFGIGLYLAREILLCHEGFLKAKRKEKGLIMEVYLPG